MASESTPLIQTVRVGPSRRRYSHGTCRRFCTIASVCVLIAGFAVFLLHAYLVWPNHYHHGHHSRHSESRANGETALSFKDLEAILLDTPSSELAEKWLQYYTSGPHLAGKNLSQAEWTRDKWEQWGISSHIVAYDCYTNYPVDHSLALLKQSKHSKSWDVDFKASLEEDILEEDATSGLEDRIPTFHGYSASGNVTGSFIYVNYGTYQDYEDLINIGVNFTGKIVIARYGGIFRGLKVKRAQELGAVGALLYSDPGDDGEITEENGYDYYPNGPARHPSSVQRGSVQFLSFAPGDPTTPGYPSKPGVPRAPADLATPSIPSIPISYTDALPILKALNSHGPKAKDFSKYWQRNLGLGYKGVEYHIGPSPEDTVLNLYNEQEYVITPQWNVIGIVNGTIPDEVVIVGNHRDAWIAGGAADPNSGSAAINEVIRSVGKALEAGWKPLRTIVFASWDGEEYGLVGSTEWVEEYLPWLQDANIAYVNLDVAVSGPYFGGGATPSLNQALRDATHKVLSPNQTVKGQTIGDLWDGRIDTLGSGSDFTAFQDYAGVPCLSLTFGGSHGTPVYHYHSNYDSFSWMSKFGDPGFKYHKAMAQLFGVLLAELTDSIVLPLGATEYVDALDSYLEKVEGKLNAAAEPTTDEEIFALRASVSSDEAKGSEDAFKASLLAIHEALASLRIKALKVDQSAAWANNKLKEGLPWWNIIGKIRLGQLIASVNKKYKYLERQFLYEAGLDGRSWFKHVVYAPGLWTGYSGAVFPGLSESVDAKDYRNGLKWAGIIKKTIEQATKSLE
jgi:N-acetylated-alpha-linked acidic dipeptidase